MPPQKKKLLDQVSETFRMKHYSHRIEQSYLDWIKPYILFPWNVRGSRVGSSEMLGATDWSSGELAGPCDHSDEGNAFIEGNDPCGDNGRIRGDFESILCDVLLPVVMLHLVQ